MPKQHFSSLTLAPTPPDQLFLRRPDHAAATAELTEWVLVPASGTPPEHPVHAVNKRAVVAVIAADACLIERDASAATVVADRWRTLPERHIMR